MAKEKKELFWMGAGVKVVDGVDYDSTMPLPVDKINKDDLEKMIGDGRIGEKIAPVKAGVDAAIATLQEKIVGIEGEKKSLAKANGELQNTIDGLADVDEKIAGLEDQVKEGLEKITELEEQAIVDAVTIEDATTDAAADKVKIGELETQVKELTPKADK